MRMLRCSLAIGRDNTPLMSVQGKYAKGEKNTQLAIIAHAHGKPTLVDAMLRPSARFATTTGQNRVMARWTWGASASFNQAINGGRYGT